MDKLTAYQILKLSPDSSIEDVKAAYAALSKEFHPEEYPEEFQQIHEAYTLLARGNRRGSRRENVRTEVGFEDTFGSGRTEEIEKADSVYDFNGVLHQAERKKEAESAMETETVGSAEKEYDFESTLHKAEEQEQERIHEVTLRALAEMQILLTGAYRNKLKLFKQFFAKEDYQEVLKKPEFLKGFAQLLEESYLKPVIYDYFIDYYRLRGLNPSELIPEAALLYRTLDNKRKMDAKRKGNIAYVVPAGVVAGLQAGLRQVKYTGETFKTLVLCMLAVVAVIWLLIWLYRKLYENHSSIFSQAVLAAGIFVSQFFVVMGELYGTFFGNVENGILIASLLFMAAGVWLVVLGIAAVIHGIRRHLR